MTRFAGRVAFVSGATSGIGRATALAFAREGASVVAADIDLEGAQATAGLIEQEGGTAHALRCDVTRADDITAALDATVQRYGGLDVAFNNAGIGGEDLFADELGAWKRVIEIDLTAVVDATRVAVRKMRQLGRGGAIVNTASLIGLGPMASAPVYAAAKAGVVNFTRSLAHLAEEARIRVNAICPELVDTPMASALGEEQLGRLRSSGGILRPEDIAAAVLELIEDESRAGAIMTITATGGRAFVTP